MGTRVDVPAVLEGFDDLAGFIASPPSNRPMAAAAGAAGQAFCDAWSSVPPWLKIDYFLPPGAKRRGLPDLLCQPYFAGNGFDPPVFEPPFSGGQCDELYRMVGVVRFNTFVSSLGQNFDSQIDVTGEIDLPGPVSGVSFRYDTPGSSGNRRWVMDVQAGQGLVVGYRSFLNPVEGNSVSNARFDGGFENSGGGPGVCGDPAPILTPGDNPAPTPPTPPLGEEPGFDPATGQPFFFVPDYEAPNSEPTPIYPPGSGGDGSGGDGGGSSTPPEAGDELGGEGSGQGGGDNDFGEPPEGQRWAGCEIRLSDIPDGTGVIPQSLPQTIYTAVQGNARLRFDAGGQPGYDTPIQIKSKSVWLWEPVRGANPSGVFVNLRPGIGYTVRPYYVPLEQ